MSVLIYLLQHLWSLPWSPFLCLLHINFWVLTGVLMLLKAKCDHLHHVCADGLAPWWWRWSRRCFFFVYCVSNFEYCFLFSRGLDKYVFPSYNTTPAEEGIMYFLCSDHMVCPCDLICVWPHNFHCFQSTDHMRWLVCFFSTLYTFPRCRRSDFEMHFPTSKWWPHIIFSDMDLTTFLTIVTSGVHGDKMSGEYEKAVFA